ncbi:MAG TPA: hypothetical protein VNO54_24515 [Streptosporangiaceae bacterium]|nr:hypothetical protein [Streptosporangiaceae bacterium]
MPDDLTDAEKQLLAEHRAKNKKARQVKIFGEHEGSKYEFTVEGEEADAVIARHAGLFAKPADDEPGKPPKPRSILGGSKS